MGNDAICEPFLSSNGTVVVLCQRFVGQEEETEDKKTSKRLTDRVLIPIYP